jgi:hypothetical protein
MIEEDGTLESHLKKENEIADLKDKLIEVYLCSFFLIEYGKEIHEFLQLSFPFLLPQ